MPLDKATLTDKLVGKTQKVSIQCYSHELFLYLAHRLLERLPRIPRCMKRENFARLVARAPSLVRLVHCMIEHGQV